MTVIKGIRNPATACHVSCPLLLNAYALQPLAQAVVAAVPHCTNGAFLRAWAHVLDQLLDAETPAHDIDPNDFYDKVQDAARIPVHKLGDAVTSMVKMLTLLREDQALGQIMETALYSGRCSSLLHGKLNDASTKYIVERNKRTKERALPVPLHVAVPKSEENSETSLEEAIRQSLAPQPVDGYQWSGSYDETRVRLPGGLPLPVKDDAELETTKQLQIHELAPFWLIHVDHFANIGGRVQSLRQKCTIPMTIDATIVCQLRSDGSSTYSLAGAILHLSDRDASSEVVDDEEDGHYVVVVRSSGSDDVTWTLVDDMTTTEIDQETCLNLLAGCKSNLSENGTYMQACLLVYESVDATHRIQPRLRDLLEQVKESKQKAESVVGRRLTVLWGKGKYYAGVVLSFDQATGKHTVQYDDGDIRSYNLSKKTIQWLDVDPSVRS